MAKLKELWEGLTPTKRNGTYIRPHLGGYEFGRWSRTVYPWGDHVRFDRLGERSTMDECRAAFESFDKAADKKAERLRRGRR